MKNEGVECKIMLSEKYIGQGHDAKGIGMELVHRDFEKTSHLHIEGRDGKSNITFKLVSGESIVPLGGLIGSIERAQDDDGISGGTGSQGSELFNRARAQGALMVNQGAPKVSAPRMVSEFWIF